MRPSAGRKLRVPDEVAELLRGLHPHLKAKLKAAFREIARVPFAGKALKEELAGLRSFRVQKFRIIYAPGEDDTIDVVSVGPRKNIYEETLRLLRREER